MTEKQLHMEQSIRAFVEKSNTELTDTIIGMLQPRFVECSAEEASLTLAYPAMAWERNPLNVMQGGVVATILDFSIACLAVY